jgi:DNA-binding beta-propeller fold protein YncE
MEENVQELLKDKDENIVQFNLNNNTSNPITVNLFDTNTLSNVPVVSTTLPPTYPLLNTITTTSLNGSSCSDICTSNNTIWFGSYTNDVYVLDINTNVLITTITIPLFTAPCYSISYCPTNNSMYLTSKDSGGDPIAVINCNTYTITYIPVLVIGDDLSGTSYNSNNNTLYVGAKRGLNSLIYFVDCSTNIISSSPLFPISPYINFSNPTNNNFIYFRSQSQIQKIDCSTNTIVFIGIPVFFISNFTQLNYNLNNNFIYISNVLGNNISVLNTNTDTIFTNISFPFPPIYLALNPVTNQLVTTLNINFFYQAGFIDCNSNTLNQVINYGSTTGVLSTVNYIPSSGIIWLGTKTTPNQYLLIDSNAITTPFFISGSANYNSFVNNLNNEPVYIDEIRVLAQNQNQLYNQVQFTKIDSNGNQIFYPEFPITKVDSYQQQGNIAGLKLNGLVFDGRTYINQYVVNPNEIVSVEIYYKQLDRLSASPTFPIFFKPKIQLKDYIKKDLDL